METVIRTTNLNYLDFLSYPDISIPCGKVTFLSGKSGSGKSTLFKLLNGTRTPSTGSIEYNGININEIDTISLRREVLLASQEVYLFDGTIKENFEQYYSVRDTIYIDETKMRDYLSLCCMDVSLDTRCETMSGGERQRIFIAICLSFMPKVLMLDEPTAALDDTTSACLLIQLKEFCEKNNMTAIVICHNQKLIEAYADNWISLDKKVGS